MIARLEAKQRASRPYTDLGNAERLVLDHGEDIRHVVGAGWHAWDGKCWRRGDDGELMRRAKTTVRNMKEEAAALPSAKPSAPDPAEALWKHAKASERKERLTAMIALAESEPKVIARADDLDADPLLLNTLTGTVDLRTGELRPHRREDLITKVALAEYDPEAKCPHFERFLTEIVPDEGVRTYLQRAVGYSLTGDTREQCLFLLEGDGANGKSTLLEAMAETFGVYARHTDASTFMTQRPRGVKEDIARLRGARLVVASEVEYDARFAEVLVKQMTGGDRLVASFLYQNSFEFRPQFKVWLSVNRLPQIRGTDHAIWRRIRRIPFHVKIERPDKALPGKLRKELPGILNWAIEGCLAWQNEGLYPPESVRAATEDYRSQEYRRPDAVASFVKARCHMSPAATATPSAMYAAYRKHCAQQGVRPMRDDRFKAALEQLGAWRDDGPRRRLWRGIGLVGGSS